MRRIARALQTVPPDELPNTAGATVEAAVCGVAETLPAAGLPGEVVR
jgi:hypothetical protein